MFYSIANFHYLFGPAAKEKVFQIKGKLFYPVVVTETTAHLVSLAQTHDCFQFSGPKVELHVGGIFTKAKVGVTANIGENGANRIFVIEERAIDIGAIGVGAVAPIDTLGAEFPQLCGPQCEEQDGIEFFRP